MHKNSGLLNSSVQLTVICATALLSQSLLLFSPEILSLIAPVTMLNESIEQIITCTNNDCGDYGFRNLRSCQTL